MMRLIVTLTSILSVYGFHHSLPSASKLSKLFADEQEIKDLNLEQMFDVFEEADKKVKLPSSSSQNYDATKQIGSSAPFGFFDPAGFSSSITEDQFKLYQEAEIKHGRVSMIAFLGIVFGELLQNGGIFFDGKIQGPAIYQYQQADAVFPFSTVVLALIGAIELFTITKAWQPLGDTLREPSGLAKLRSDYEPGMLGFDPLGLAPKNSKELDIVRVKELNNGRLAMIAVAGIVAQELVSGNPIF